MTYREKALLFDCAGECLLGILAEPPHASRLGVVILVGGPQYRAGSHRQFVLLARALAAGGYPVLRFDYRGMGDSSGAPRHFEAVGDDIGAAVSALQAACRDVDRIVLLGLCDGASAALLYLDASRDPRIEGLVLLNPWVRSEESLARTQVKHYYGQRLLQPGFWLRLLRGEVAVAHSLRGLGRSIGLALARPAAPVGDPPYQTRMARAWRNFDGSILLILSGRDYTAKEFLEYAGRDPAWSGGLAQGTVQRADLPEADHTFSAGASQGRLENLILRWLREVEKRGEDIGVHPFRSAQAGACRKACF